MKDTKNSLIMGGAAIAAGVVAKWLMEKQNRDKLMEMLEFVIEKARETAEDRREIAEAALDKFEGELKKR